MIVLLALTAAFGHVLYPLWLWIVSRRANATEPPQPDAWPDLTVLVPAYRERTVIAEKVHDALGNGYPGSLEVLVVADDPETAEAARPTPARVLAFDGRLGKAEAINRGVTVTRNPVVVLTDANTKLAPGALARLARWFADPGVSAVAGEKTVVDGGGEALYWRFESWLKRRESRTGTTIGLVGELAAVRRDCLRALPSDVIVDDLWLALDIVEQGGRIIYEPNARAEEQPSPSSRAEWRRRTRNVAGLLDVLWRRRWHLVPGASPVTFQLWGHRLVRSTFGPLAHAGLLVVALRSVRRSRTARGFVAAHVVAARALGAQMRGDPISPPEQAAAQVLYLQAVALAGLVRYLSGDRPAKWEKAAR
jgi:cellulose synthase/poly-beta-1,6-N-acetylglucosamine synthase-like glycosyltransferase